MFIKSSAKQVHFTVKSIKLSSRPADRFNSGIHVNMQIYDPSVLVSVKIVSGSGVGIPACSKSSIERT